VGSIDRRLRLAGATAAPLLAALALAALLPPVAAADDTGLSVVARGQVADVAPTGAWEPAVTRAPNGDLLVAFPTSTDGGLGGKVMLTRSTNGGVTWSTPTVLYTPSHYKDSAGNSIGASVMSVGMTTLRDGTILLPFSEVHTISAFDNREAVMFLARSTDNGITWSGLNAPITLPRSIREPFQYGRILELSDGTLLMPEWGSLTLTADWQSNPDPWRAGLLRSTDGGTTWSSYSTIAVDPNVSFDSNVAGGVNETSVEQLRDGRLVAAVRYYNPLERINGIAMSRRLFVTYSSDSGLTWSAPQAVNLQAQSPSLTQTPCSSGLSSTTTKLALGYRSITPNFGFGAVSVSYNGGVTWQGQLQLQNPSGSGFTSSYPAFQDLGNRRMIAVFMGQPSPGAAYRVYYNILEDASATDCQSAADAAAQRDRDHITVFVERQDRADWTFNYGLTQKTYAASTVVSSVVGGIGYAVTCKETDPLELVRVRPGTANVVLDQTRTFAQNGVQTGDVLRVRAATAPSGPLKIGFSDFDHHPTDGEVVNWGTACRTARAGLDGLVRSLGIRATIPAGRAITSISLRSTGSTTRLTSSDYTLYVSNDNRFYQPITGWTLGSQVDGNGRLVHTFRSLSITQPYIKIHQPYDGVSGITFILDNPHQDVTATFGP
jgi:hypothetical protein